MARPLAARDRSPLLRYGSGRADDDNDELSTRSRQFTIPDKRGGLHVPRLPLRTLLYALNGGALFVLLSLCISMHNTISRLETRAGSSVETARDIQQDTTNAHKELGAGALHFISKDGLLPMALLPSKFAVDYVTPRQDQAYRGTCWDFATIGFLEQSYRAHGVRKGWLQPDEYVAFSEQAYGVEVLKLCTGDADSQQQKDCRVAGDEMWMNSTEGGEVPELYYLQNGLKESIFPQSVCKYYTDDGNDTLCPGLEAAQAAGNPLKFELSSMATKYEDMSVREHLVRKNQAMPLSTPIAMVTHYYPCIGEFANDRHCQPETCTLCPGDMATTTCCIPLKGGRNRNMEGEFFSHRGMSIEGGHAMLLVGYNDAFLTREGFTGGLIVKNSWADGPTQGSHSLAYWMQEVSDWEERSVCPNSYNPCGRSRALPKPGRAPWRLCVCCTASAPIPAGRRRRAGGPLAVPGVGRVLPWARDRPAFALAGVHRACSKSDPRGAIALARSGLRLGSSRLTRVRTVRVYTGLNFELPLRSAPTNSARLAPYDRWNQQTRPATAASVVPGQIVSSAAEVCPSARGVAEQGRTALQVAAAARLTSMIRIAFNTYLTLFPSDAVRPQREAATRSSSSSNRASHGSRVADESRSLAAAAA